MVELALAQARSSANLDRLTEEMRGFKEEMRAFKDRMEVSYQKLQASDEKLQASNEKLQASSDAADRRMGSLTNQLGRLVEDIVGPSIPALFGQLFEIPEIAVAGIRVKRSHRSKPGHTIELDAVAAGGDVLLVVEVKSRLGPGDLSRLAEKLSEVRDYFPEWAEGRRVFGAVASFHVDDSLVRDAEGRGLFAFGLDRNLVEVLNSKGFEPRSF